MQRSLPESLPCITTIILKLKGNPKSPLTKGKRDNKGNRQMAKGVTFTLAFSMRAFSLPRSLSPFAFSLPRLSAYAANMGV